MSRCFKSENDALKEKLQNQVKLREEAKTHIATQVKSAEEALSGYQNYKVKLLDRLNTKQAGRSNKDEHDFI